MRAMIGTIERRRGLLVALLLVLALGARVGYVAATPHYVPHHDDRDYMTLSQSIAATGAYPTHHVWLAPGHCPVVNGPRLGWCVARPHGPGARLVARPTAYRPPAYPYALAGAETVGRWLGVTAMTSARVFQALLGTLVAALVGLLAARLLGRRVGLVALAIAAVEIPLVVLSGTLLSESLFVAFVLGALLATLASAGARHPLRWLALAGVLSGLAALTRTNGALVLLPIAVLVWRQSGGTTGGRRLRRALPVALVTVAALATVSVWTIRNAVVMGSFVPVSTESGGTLLGTYNPSSRADRETPGNWLLITQIPREAAVARQWTAFSEPVLDARLGSDARRFAVSDPAYVAKVVWWNSLRLLDLTGTKRVRFGASTVDVPGGIAVAGAALFHVLGVLALAGALLPAARRVPRPIWLVPLLMWLSTVVVESETPRFRAGVEPFVIVLAALALSEATRGGLGERLRRSARRLRGGHALERA